MRFLFGWDSFSPFVFGMGCVILLWHSLGFPYNYFSSVCETILTLKAPHTIKAEIAYRYKVSGMKNHKSLVVLEIIKLI